MQSTNLVIVRGYTGASPRGFDNGKVAKVSVATNRKFTDRATGECKEITDWVTLTILDETRAKWALENIRKGDPIFAQGRVAERSYKKGDQTVYSTDVIVSDIDRLVATTKEERP